MLERLLRLLPLSDIAYAHDVLFVAVDGHIADPDVHWKAGSVPTTADGLAWPRIRCVVRGSPAIDEQFLGVGRFSEQSANRLSNNLFGRVAKNVLGGAIEGGDAAVLTDRDDPLGHVTQHGTELCLVLLQRVCLAPDFLVQVGPRPIQEHVFQRQRAALDVRLNDVARDGRCIRRNLDGDDTQWRSLSGALEHQDEHTLA